MQHVPAHGPGGAVVFVDGHEAVSRLDGAPRALGQAPQQYAVVNLGHDDARSDLNTILTSIRPNDARISSTSAHKNKGIPRNYENDKYLCSAPDLRSLLIRAQLCPHPIDSDKLDIKA